MKHPTTTADGHAFHDDRKEQQQCERAHEHQERRDARGEREEEVRRPVRGEYVRRAVDEGVQVTCYAR